METLVTSTSASLTESDDRVQAAVALMEIASGTRTHFTKLQTQNATNMSVTRNMPVTGPKEQSCPSLPVQMSSAVFATRSQIQPQQQSAIPKCTASTVPGTLPPVQSSAPNVQQITLQVSNKMKDSRLPVNVLHDPNASIRHKLKQIVRGVDPDYDQIYRDSRTSAVFLNKVADEAPVLPLFVQAFSDSELLRRRSVDSNSPGTASPEGNDFQVPQTEDMKPAHILYSDTEILRRKEILNISKTGTDCIDGATGPQENKPSFKTQPPQRPNYKLLVQLRNKLARQQKMSSFVREDSSMNAVVTSGGVSTNFTPGRTADPVHKTVNSVSHLKEINGTTNRTEEVKDRPSKVCTITSPHCKTAETSTFLSRRHADIMTEPQRPRSEPSPECRLPPKKRKFAASANNTTDGDAANALPRRESASLPTSPPGLEIDPGSNLIMLAECQMAVRPDEDGDLPLHIAVAQGNEEMVDKLIELMKISNVHLDVFNNSRQTPLHLAVIAEEGEIIEKLLQGGAHPNISGRHGQTAIHLAVKNATTNCLAILLAKRKGRLNLNAKDYEGLTALHLAALRDNLAAVQLLCEHGADIDNMDGKSGRTALHHAAENNHQDIVEMLCNKGASVNLQSYTGHTALNNASGRGNMSVVMMLIRFGADTTIKSGNQESTGVLSKEKREIAELSPLKTEVPGESQREKQEVSTAKQSKSAVKESKKSAKNGVKGTTPPKYKQDGLALEETIATASNPVNEDMTSAVKTAMIPMSKQDGVGSHCKDVVRKNRSTKTKEKTQAVQPAVSKSSKSSEGSVQTDEEIKMADNTHTYINTQKGRSGNSDSARRQMINEGEKSNTDTSTVIEKGDRSIVIKKEPSENGQQVAMQDQTALGPPGLQAKSHNQSRLQVPDPRFPPYMLHHFPPNMGMPPQGYMPMPYGQQRPMMPMRFSQQLLRLRGMVPLQRYYNPGMFNRMPYFWPRGNIPLHQSAQMADAIRQPLQGQASDVQQHIPTVVTQKDEPSKEEESSKENVDSVITQKNGSNNEERSVKENTEPVITHKEGPNKEEGSADKNSDNVITQKDASDKGEGSADENTDHVTIKREPVEQEPGEERSKSDHTETAFQTSVHIKEEFDVDTHTQETLDQEAMTDITTESSPNVNASSVIKSEPNVDELCQKDKSPMSATIKMSAEHVTSEKLTKANKPCISVHLDSNFFDQADKLIHSKSSSIENKETSSSILGHMLMPGSTGLNSPSDTPPTLTAVTPIPDFVTPWATPATPPTPQIERCSWPQPLTSSAAVTCLAEKFDKESTANADTHSKKGTITETAGEEENTITRDHRKGLDTETPKEEGNPTIGSSFNESEVVSGQEGLYGSMAKQKSPVKVSTPRRGVKRKQHLSLEVAKKSKKTIEINEDSSEYQKHGIKLSPKNKEHSTTSDISIGDNKVMNRVPIKSCSVVLEDVGPHTLNNEEVRVSADVSDNHGSESPSRRHYLDCLPEHIQVELTKCHGDDG